MSTVADTPVPRLAPELPLQPAAAVLPAAVVSNTRRLKDTLVAIYAYGLLPFGLFFPVVLMIWAAFFLPDTQ